MYADGRTEEDYEEDMGLALDYAIKLIDVDKMLIDDAVSLSSTRYDIPATDLMRLVEMELRG